VASLQVRLLGHVDMVVDGEVVEVPGRLARSALAGLALRAPAPVSSAWLSELIWQDEPPRGGTLRVMISRLRKLLGPMSGRLVARANGYALLLEPSELDVTVLATSIDRAEDWLQRGQTHDALTHARVGRSLLRGPALGDVADLTQLAGDCAALADLAQRCHHVYAQCLVKSGQPDLASAVLAELLRHAPLDERVARDLAVALFRDDRQAAALDVLKQLRHELVTELGVSPSTATQEVELAILRHDPLLIGPASDAGVRSPFVDSAIVNSSQEVVLGRSLPALVLAPRFSARVAERNELARVWQRACVGHGDAVVVTGDEGLGKSSLLAQFVHDIDEPVIALWGVCRSDEVGAYGMWVGLLDELRQRPELSALGPQLDSLANRLMASSSPIAGDLAKIDTGLLDQQRRQLFGDVVTLVERLATSHPLVIVVDDVHWADAASLALLRYVIEATRRVTALFILSWRPREAAQHHSLVDVSRDLTTRNCSFVQLMPLPLDAITTWALECFPDLAGTALSDVSSALSDATAGHPLFLGDVRHALWLAGNATPTPGDIAAVACPSVEAIIDRRLAGANPSLIAKVNAMAILGDDASLAALAALTSATTGEVAADVDALVGLGLVREVGPGRFCFANPSYQRAVMDRLGPAQRAVMHAHSLDVLDALGASASTLAQHALAAGQLVSPARSADVLQRAGADALKRTGFVEAAKLLERAVEVAPLDTDSWVLLADARWRTGRISAAKAAAVQGARLALDSANVNSAAAAINIHSTFGAQGANDDTSLALIDRAIQLANTRPDVAILRAFELYHRAMWSEPADRVRRLRDEVASLDATDLPMSVRSELWWAAGVARFADSDIESRDRIANDLIMAGRVAGSARYVGRGLRLRCLSALESQSFEQVALLLEQLVDVAEAAGSWLYRSDAQRWSVAAAMARGEWDQATVLIADGERLSAGPLAGHVTPNAGGWWISRGLGRSDDALRDFDQLLPHGRTLFPLDHGFSGVAHALHMALMLDVGDDERARARLRELSVASLLDQASVRSRGGLIGLLCDVADRLDDRSLAALLRPRVDELGGNQLLLGWGEALLGSANRCRAQLNSVLDRTDGGALEAVARNEERYGWHGCAADTIAAARRADRRAIDRSAPSP
jgi:DNA-binding SARP family transcriptional activator/tetratricopeptide (TPR) repeat protein